MNIYHKDDVPNHLHKYFKDAPQLGLEKTPELYVAKMVEVFREVRRILKKEGTLWLNLGDSYAGGGRGCNTPIQQSNRGTRGMPDSIIPDGLKQKDLVGIPWRVAFALQKDGWYLRQDIIWHKPNPMPESVTDRCTKSHEYIFLLAKSQKYYFNYKEIQEKSIWFEKDKRAITVPSRGGKAMSGEYAINKGGAFQKNGMRNKRSVWVVNTNCFRGAHFATFPEALIEPMIKTGCPKEVCKKCGKARHPIMQSEYQKKEVKWHPEKYGNNDESGARRGRMQPTCAVKNTSKNIGWTDCGCSAGFGSGIILDPFAGAGTTGVVALKQGKKFIGIELNKKYIDDIMMPRLENNRQLFI